jgi:polyhydroxyalkanoate synthesis repressor PhaR
MPQPRVVIRKYENRRLYDTARSRYVNLEEVAEMVRQGVDVQVVDARTGEDLTRLVLTQIIVDDAKGQESALPLDFLRQLVMASGRATQEGFAGYMKTVFDTYQQAYDTFQRTLRDTSAASLAPLDFLHSVFGPKEQDAVAGQGAREPGTAKAEEPEPAPEAPATRPADLPALLQRIEELERRLGEAPRTPKRRRAARRG